VRWTEEGGFESNGYRIIYSGGKERQRGVAIILDRDTAKRVIDVKMCGDRMMMVKLNGDVVNMCLIQVYMQTTGHADDEVDAEYEKLEEMLGAQKESGHAVIMGDWNAMVGE